MNLLTTEAACVVTAALPVICAMCYLKLEPFRRHKVATYPGFMAKRLPPPPSSVYFEIDSYSAAYCMR